MHKKDIKEKKCFYMDTNFWKKLLSIWKTGKMRTPGVNPRKKKSLNRI